MPTARHLIVIAGPTAVGKTALCIDLAQKLKTEIISADSRQIFKEMKIGTAKPSPEELQGVPHHFIDFNSVTKPYTAGQFEADVMDKLDSLFKNHQAIIMTGGSGFYIDAVCYGIDDKPEANEAIRKELNHRLEREGLNSLVLQLKKLDPVYHIKVDLSNPRRVIRALEVCLSSGKPYSDFQSSKTKERPFNIIKICLERDREELYNHINQRVDRMIENGLVKEAKGLLSAREHQALQTVGYRELFEYLDGNTSLEEAIKLIKQNTRRYAKRQMTWFRRNDDYHYFHPDQVDEIFTFICSELEK